MGDDSVSVIIVAGGNGKRVGGTIPKQFLELSGRPVLMHTIDRFHSILPQAEIIVVIHPTEILRWKSICKTHSFSTPHKIVGGGEERFHSVKNGIMAVQSGCKTVMIQDAVRIFFNKALIGRLLSAAKEYKSVIPVINVTDSLRKKEDVSDKSHIVNRNNYVAVQTPQVFDFKLIKECYETEWRHEFTDDASVVEHFGEHVYLVEGECSNIKITTKEDFLYAETLLKSGK